jgi:DNA-binding Xre family transcriptional regulator
MNDKPISTDSIEKLCQILGCDVAELMQYIPDTKTK